jgi:beta-lactamase class A
LDLHGHDGEKCRISKEDPIDGQSQESVPALDSELRSIVSGQPGQWAFSVMQNGERRGGLNEKLVLPAASTIKVPILIGVLREVADGRRDLDAWIELPKIRTGGTGVLSQMPSVARLTLREALTLMITVSDNTATNVLIDHIGIDVLQAHLQQLDMKQTSLRRRMLDVAATRSGRDNVTTAHDQASVLDGLYRSTFLPARLTQEALTILGAQQANDRIPALLGSEVSVLHKTADLPGIHHDVGILVSGARSFVFAGMVAGWSPNKASTDNIQSPASLIGQAARASLEFLWGRAR